MTNQHYDLRLAIACYLKNESILLPPYYHDQVVNAYKHGLKQWNVEQAAALTLFTAFYDGVLQLDDLLYTGQVALIWAENHIEEFNIRPLSVT